MEKFRDLPYKRPDAVKLLREVNGCVRALKTAKDFEAANDALLRVHETVYEAGTQYVIAQIRRDINTKDAFYQREMKFYNTALPLLAPALKRAVKALLESPFRPRFEALYGAQLFRTAQTQIELINLKTILPTIRENNLTTAYSRTAAGCSVEFMGEKCNFYGLLRHMQSPDREERKNAFLAWAKLYESVSPELEEQFGKLVKLRCAIAKKLGCGSYIDYVYPSRQRYDYGPAQAAEFREAVRQYITPLCETLFREQAERLGVDRLHWYDESLTFPQGNAVPVGTPEELVEQARQMYADLSPETEEYFNFMTEHGLFDLVTRENKHLGGYCTGLPSCKAPFIFSNFNGTSADVDVLTHEAGHAFQFYYATRRVPLEELAASTSEINEIHSMAMEHFAYPYMERFFGDRADQYRYAHFCGAVRTIPYLVAVDEFQHRVFENPASGPADWRRFWKEIEGRYMPWRDYDGNAFLESGGFWMQKQHIFLYPFYYIEYAMAQMGAFHLYRKQLEDGSGWRDYLTLCGLGGQYGYFETLERAGIPNPLDPETVKETAAFCEKQAAILKEKAGL